MSDSVTYPDAITSGAAVSPPPTWVTTYRPAAPRDGLLGYATNTNQLELYQAGAWRQVTTSFQGVDILSGYGELPGAKGDGVILFSTVTVLSATPTAFAILSAAFTSDDVGKIISIDNVGVGGIPMVTTIATVVDATHITTTDAASTTGNFYTDNRVTYGTSDSAAISAILQAMRADGGILIATAVAMTVVFPSRIYIIDFPLDFTDFHRLYVLAPGATFWGITDGLPVVDAFGFYQGVFDGLTIIGDEGAAPNIGIAGGRYNDEGAHGLTHFRDVLLRGYFTFTPLYVRGLETTTWLNVTSETFSAGAWAFVSDGANHWDIQSEWVTVDLAINDPFSNSGNTFIGCRFIAYTLTSNGLWLCNIKIWRWISQYTRTRGFGLWFYNVPGRQSYINYQGTFDGTESGSEAAYIFVEKSAATALNALTLDVDTVVVSGKAIFAASSAGNPCLLQACAITIQEIEAGGNLFADVAEWSVYGNSVTIVLPSAAPTLPAIFYGTVSISQSTTTIYHATVIP